MDRHATTDFMHLWKPSDGLMKKLNNEGGSQLTSTLGGEKSNGTKSPVDVIPSHVRGSTPDNVTSIGKILLKSSRRDEKYIDTGNLQKNSENNFAGSTRDIVTSFTSDVGRPETSRDGENLEMQRSPDEAGFTSNTANEENKKNGYFLPKCLSLLVGLMIVLAGVVALIVIVDKDKPEPRGQVLPDPITHDECQGRSFYLGDILNFTCIFDTTHEYRKILRTAANVTVIPKGRVSTSSSPNYVLEVDNKEPSHYVMSITGDSQAKCSSAGEYEVNFKNINNIIIHSSRVTFTIKGSSLKTTMTQRVLSGSKCLDTEFDVTCNLHNDCNNYHTTIYRRKLGREESLNQYLKCKKNYTDEDGYMVNCSATIPDNFVENYVYLDCRMDTVLPNNKRLKLNAPFTLPECGVESKCYTREPNFEPFNCSQKASDFQNLLNAKCDATRLKQCLKPGRLVFRANKDLYGNLTCSDDNEVDNVVPVCRLSWCKDYRVIRKNEIPGVVVCSNFNEPYVSPTTTTSTTTSAATTTTTSKSVTTSTSSSKSSTNPT